MKLCNERLYPLSELSTYDVPTENTLEQGPCVQLSYYDSLIFKTIFKVFCMGNCDLLSLSIKVKNKGEARVLGRKITHSKTPQSGRRIGDELVAAHFTSFVSTDDGHIMSLSALKHAKHRNL